MEGGRRASVIIVPRRGKRKREGLIKVYSPFPLLVGGNNKRADKMLFLLQVQIRL
jgi:hypothetical protein